MRFTKLGLWSVALAAAVLTVAPLAARAQENPISTSFRTDIEAKMKNLAAGAAEMPADKYGYKPTPAEYSFGGMVLHVAQSSSYMCSAISGEKAPSFADLTENSTKDQLVGAMKSAISFCDEALANVKDSDLSGDIALFHGHHPRAMGLVALVDDMADHYSQESIYLRINGHLPPTAMKHGMHTAQGKK
jgi:hypothetical protein